MAITRSAGASRAVKSLRLEECKPRNCLLFKIHNHNWRLELIRILLRTSWQH